MLSAKRSAVILARWDCGDGYKVTALPFKASCSSVFGLTTIEKRMMATSARKQPDRRKVYQIRAI